MQKNKLYLWDTIYNKLLNKGVNSFDIDIRYLQRWIDLYPCCFPKFMLSKGTSPSFRAIFNWELMRWEIVITYEGNYYDTIKKESMYFYHDTQHFVIGVQENN